MNCLDENDFGPAFWNIRGHMCGSENALFHDSSGEVYIGWMLPSRGGGVLIGATHVVLIGAGAVHDGWEPAPARPGAS